MYEKDIDVHVSTAVMKVNLVLNMILIDHYLNDVGGIKCNINELSPITPGPTL